MSLHLSKCHIVGTHMPWLNVNEQTFFFDDILHSGVEIDGLYFMVI